MSFESPRPATPAEDDEIDLGQLLGQLWAGKVWIAGFTVAAGLLAAGHLANTPPTYRADALLQLEEKGRSLGLPEALSPLTGGEARSGTEIEILRSRLVLGEAVAGSQLDRQARPVQVPLIGHAVRSGLLPLPDLDVWRRYDRGDTAVRLDLLELPPEWVGKTLLLTAEGEGRFSLLLPDGSRAEGQVGAPLALPGQGLALRIGELAAPPGRQVEIRQIDEAAAIGALRGRLSVTERGRQSSILEVSLTGGDPVEAQYTLGAITEAYLRQNTSRNAAEAQSSLEFIERQLPEAQRAVAEAETRLNAYRQERQAIDLGFEGQSLLTEIGKIEADLRQLASEEEDVAARYTPNHPVYRKLLNARTRLEERLAARREEVGNLPETQRDVFNLTRDQEVAQEVYLQLLNRAQELRVVKASTIGNVRIVDAARTAPQPIAPRRSRVMALALLLGALGGAGFVLARNWLTRGIRGPEDLERLGLPVFATLLFAPAAVRAGRGRDRGMLPVLALSDPHSVTVEGVRSLRTSLHFGMLDATSRSIAITSSAPGAGKSFTAVNLAVVAAQAGQRVCLVDADLRRGHLRRYFALPKGTPGLAEYLAEEADLDELLRPGPVEGMAFLPTGQLPPNPSELLMRPSLARLVGELDRRFDLTIFDAPPALAVTDPVVIGRAVGATIAVVRHEVTNPGEVEALVRQVQGAGVRIAGAVLNAYRPHGRHGRYGYGYGYGYGYRYDSYRPQSGD